MEKVSSLALVFQQLGGQPELGVGYDMIQGWERTWHWVMDTGCLGMTWALSGGDHMQLNQIFIYVCSGLTLPWKMLLLLL